MLQLTATAQPQSKHRCLSPTKLATPAASLASTRPSDPATTANPIPITDRPARNRRHALPRHQNPHQVQRIGRRQRHRLPAQRQACASPAPTPPPPAAQTARPEIHPQIARRESLRDLPAAGIPSATRATAAGSTPAPANRESQFHNAAAASSTPLPPRADARPPHPHAAAPTAPHCAADASLRPLPCPARRLGSISDRRLSNPSAVTSPAATSSHKRSLDFRFQLARAAHNIGKERSAPLPQKIQHQLRPVTQPASVSVRPASRAFARVGIPRRHPIRIFPHKKRNRRNAGRNHPPLPRSARPPPSPFRGSHPNPASPDAATTFPNPPLRSGKADPATSDRNPQSAAPAPAAPTHSPESQTPATAAELPASPLARNLRPRSHMLPAQQPAHELRRRDRLNLLPQHPHRQPMNPRQQPPLAPLRLVRVWDSRSGCPCRARALPPACRQRHVKFPRRTVPLASIRSKAFSISEAASPKRLPKLRSRRRPHMRHPPRHQRQQSIVAGNVPSLHLSQLLLERASGNNAEKLRARSAATQYRRPSTEAIPARPSLTSRSK